MDSRRYLKPFKFQKRLTKYSTNAYYLDYLDRNGNVREVLLKARAHHQLDTLNEFMEDKDIWKPELSKERIAEEEKKLVKSTLDMQEQLIDDFFVVHVNQNLVTLCTVFDTFLVDCISVITYMKQETLKSLCSDNDISLDDLVSSRGRNEVFFKVQDRLIQRFDFMGIKDKIKLFQKLGVSKEALFSIDNEEWGNKYPNPQECLFETYSFRNDIVHRDEMKLKSYEDLSYRADLLLHLIMKWGMITFTEKFGVTSDFILLANNQAQYNELDTD
jgi:hypothetical protein